MMPSAYAVADHNMGCRAALNWNSGGPDDVGCEIIGAAGARWTRTDSACQVNDGFEMESLGKKIDEVELLDTISAYKQDDEIAREGHRIA